VQCIRIRQRAKQQRPRSTAIDKGNRQTQAGTFLTVSDISSVVVHGNFQNIAIPQAKKFYTVFMAKLEFPFFRMSWGVFPLNPFKVAHLTKIGVFRSVKYWELHKGFVRGRVT